MPLSDHEKKLLEEMEAALSADDPRLVSALSGRPRSARLLYGILSALGGMAILLAGLVVKNVPVGLLGFLACLGGILLAIKGGTLTVSAPSAPGSGKGRRGWGARLEERWERRNFDQ
jgi:Protein of unknown function (DUF3040)